MRERELPGMSGDINSLLNRPQVPSLREMHNHGQAQMLQPSTFDLTSSHDGFLQQMLSSVPSSAAASFAWADDHPPPGMMEEQSAAVLASKMRQQQINNGPSKSLMLQQQFLLSSGLAGDGGQMHIADHNDAVDAQNFNSANLANDASVKAAFNGFAGSLGQTSDQSQHVLHPQGGALQQFQNFGTPATPAMGQLAASGSSGGGSAAGQPRQRVRARRGQATDPHSIAERLRRERIAERMKGLQELVPNANKTDKASMLDEIIDYVKFLQLQVKVLSMSRLGGAAPVAPLVADKSPEGTQTASTSNNKEGMTAAEQQVAKLMEEDMGYAMQYLQGKGLCLMPISLANAISTATLSYSRNPLPSSNRPLLNGEAGGPPSPSMSGLTVQSTTMGVNAGREISVKDATAASKVQ